MKASKSWLASGARVARATLLAGLLLSVVAPTWAAQGGAFRRAGEFEYTIAATLNTDETVSGNRGSEIDLDRRLGVQVGVDYFLERQFAVGFDFGWVRPDYDATFTPNGAGGPVSVSHRADLFTGQLTGTWYASQGPVAPFAELGIGWTHVDSNLANGPPIVGCWFDPFWGYICSDFYETYQDTNLSYSATLGVRWDLPGGTFLKAGYRWLRVELDNSASDALLGNGLVELGWRF